MHNADNYLLYVDSVFYSKGGRQLLNSIFLGLKEGEIIGLLGRNGSGKSTLLKVVFGEIVSTNAYMRLKGEKFSLGYKTGDIAFLPQDGFLPLNSKIKDILYTFNLPKEEFLKLSFVSQLNDRIRNFSYGERRILEVLVLLLGNKSVILLDEPFSGLSPLQVDFIKKYIKEIKKDRGVIITDHRYQDIIEISDKLLLMKDGNTLPVNSADELIFHNYISGR